MHTQYELTSLRHGGRPPCHKHSLPHTRATPTRDRTAVVSPRTTAIPAVHASNKAPRHVLCDC
eukprot:134980-Prymnesium_polylepis.1